MILLSFYAFYAFYVPFYTHIVVKFVDFSRVEHNTNLHINQVVTIPQNKIATI